MTNQDKKPDDNDEFFIFIDGEKWNTSSEMMTPNDIIGQATTLDVASHYLVRTNRGREDYKDKGDIPIQLKKADRFQAVSLGATPLS